jgi:hypothetical protein
VACGYSYGRKVHHTFFQIAKTLLSLCHLHVPSMAQKSNQISWNRNLSRARALGMGGEFRTKGANVFLGPVVSPLGRTVTSGRNWEGVWTVPTSVNYSALLKLNLYLPRHISRPLPVWCLGIRDGPRCSNSRRYHIYKGMSRLLNLITPFLMFFIAFYRQRTRGTSNAKRRRSISIFQY